MMDDSEICYECSYVNEQPLYGDALGTYCWGKGKEEEQDIRETLLEITSRLCISDVVSTRAHDYYVNHREKWEAIKRPKKEVLAYCLYFTLVREGIIIYDMEDVASWFGLASGKRLWVISSKMGAHFCFSHVDYIEPLCNHLLHHLSFQDIMEIRKNYYNCLDPPWWEKQSFSPKNMAAAIIILFYPSSRQADITARLCPSAGGVCKIISNYKRCHSSQHQQASND